MHFNAFIFKSFTSMSPPKQKQRLTVLNSKGYPPIKLGNGNSPNGGVPLIVIGGSPSHHPFLDGIFPYKTIHFWGIPMTWETPQMSTSPIGRLREAMHLDKCLNSCLTKRSSKKRSTLDPKKNRDGGFMGFPNLGVPLVIIHF